MTFYVQGLNGHEVMPLMQLFKSGVVEKTNRVEAKKPINPTRKDIADQHDHGASEAAMQYYEEVDHIQQSSPALTASQIMQTPAVSCKSNDRISDAFELFKSHQIRHIPVVTNNEVVSGIVSERDILRYMSGITEDYTQHRSSVRLNAHINQLMKTQVLTASLDTDVRYIARLFVERRVGSMPVVNDGRLLGIITRSDILAAVMRHFILELWA